MSLLIVRTFKTFHISKTFFMNVVVVVLGGGDGVGNELAATPSKIYGGKDGRMVWYHLQ